MRLRSAVAEVSKLVPRQALPHQAARIGLYWMRGCSETRSVAHRTERRQTIVRFARDLLPGCPPDLFRSTRRIFHLRREIPYMKHERANGSPGEFRA